MGYWVCIHKKLFTSGIAILTVAVKAAPVIYIRLPSHSSLVLELARQLSLSALCHALLIVQSVRDTPEISCCNLRLLDDANLSLEGGSMLF